MSRTMRVGGAFVAAAAIVAAVVIGQGSGSRAESSPAPPVPRVPDCCPHTHARAQAVVKANGTALRKDGVMQTVRVTAGTYCIQLVATIPVTSTAPVVSQDLSLATTPVSQPVSVAVASSTPDCTQLPNSVEVQTFVENGSQRAPADEGFSVVVA